MNAVSRAAELFQSRFGRSPHWVASAPGRVNLIGEHTDYSGGWVMPIALDRRTAVAAAPATGARSRVFAAELDETGTVTLEGLTGPVAHPRWLNYVLGVVAGYRARNVAIPELDLVIASDVPIGSGLSSSAALEVATAVLLEAVLPLELVPIERIRLCRAAEHGYAGAPCGIMDMFIASEARAGEALLIDCGQETAEAVPMPLTGPDSEEGPGLLVVNTGVRHDLADGAYRERRDTCARAAAALGVESLREADLDDLVGLDAPDRHRAEHVVRENARTRAAAEDLRRGDFRAFGVAMFASHASLRDLYDVSCPELDTIVEAASECPGVLGARMTGGGFGGSAIVLTQGADLALTATRIASVFRDRHARTPQWFTTVAGAGASVP